ncbi:class I SAM-dependent DNA methyltransferase [Maricaulis sp.]|uniref:class I SAM-dependent DNA methyltransferase n=1 Tax=Maricaulis sp. TaxID=1486257 RepID=UPI003A8FD12E
MDVRAFIEKWTRAELKERSASQEHFIDLCHLLGEKTPGEADPTGETYAFEKGAIKSTGASGWADVWKQGCFGWEYKGPGKDLDKAFSQLLTYSVALENPPLLIVCDLKRIIIKTNWTNTVQKTWEFSLEDLTDGAKRQVLKDAFSNPEALKPAKTRQELTEEAASDFAEIARALRERDHEAQRVAHFVNRMVFCMFAEDVRLLPDNIFTKMLERAKSRPEDFTAYAKSLFEAMRTGGMVGFDHIDWFNGGLFDDDLVLPLERDEIETALKAARLDWSDIDPSILGTLFERGLDPDKRSQLGAHYTDRDKIMMIIGPVIIEPLKAEWDAIRAEMTALIATADNKKAKAGARTKARNKASALHAGFIERLTKFRVLDPACGSGNFLNLALIALKDIEHKANLDSEAMGLERGFPRVGPECLKGIEINPYAAELARVSIWIGEIQWMRRNGFSASRNPILRPLDAIECADALVEQHPVTGVWREKTWPEADVIVGNPPFLGDKRMMGVLGEEYVVILRGLFANRVSGGADFVIFWFAKAWEAIEAERLTRAGLVATQSIRRGASAEVLKAIDSDGVFFNAWADESWTVDGAAVRVSLVCFAKHYAGDILLSNHPVEQIFSDLSASQSGIDLTLSSKLRANSTAFIGDQKTGSFDVNADLARKWLVLPLNPNGRPNRDVLMPWVNGQDITRRPSGKWIIDFGVSSTEEEASAFEAPFEHVREHVLPARAAVRRDGHRIYWWRHGETRPAMRRALAGLPRFIVTPRVAKFRLFVWLEPPTLPDSRLVVIARSDDCTFGLVHSRYHEMWSLRLGGWHGKGNDPQYTPSLGFETFPFPAGLTPDIPAADYADDPRAIAIAAAAARLNELRENWLNPADLVRREAEVVPGYPDRILPVDEAAAAVLKKRTLTNLYNARPAWLDHAHTALDSAVASAYGWPEGLSDDEVLARLFALNQERAAQQAKTEDRS